MKNLYRFSIISSLAGFLFGFDTVVISGADQQLQLFWKTSDLFHGTVIMSMALWGTVFGAIFASYPCDKWGRKKTLIIIGLLYFISALGSAFSNDPYVFSIFRLIGGFGVGASTIAGPTYISEIAPKDKRGKLVALYQFNIVFGILIAFISNYSLQNIADESWRWMLGIEAIPALIYLIGVTTIPNSPRWLIIKCGNVLLAKENYFKINRQKLNQSQIDDIINQNNENDDILFSMKFAKPILLAFLIAFFNQLSGINAFLYYAPRIFELAGLKSSSALLSSVGIGITNLVFTMIGIFLIDTIGRRKLLKIGSIGYIFSLSMVGISFLMNWVGIIIPIFLFIFIAAHAIGQGTVIWVFIAEIFPNSLRAKGQSFGCSVHWVLAALITLFMPLILSEFSNPGYIFLIFAVIMIFQYIFVIFMMPETKNISLEKLSLNLSR
ncbi:MAG: MFS transporter [Flavobacteriaceae bacterium]|nr:MFS transporter [Flavobacteriaceae bacterium]|tara:strand:+ start:28026 stop:29339 length:1314 start_codon:yes stop_codon:yes gene_type:complete